MNLWIHNDYHFILEMYKNKMILHSGCLLILILYIFHSGCSMELAGRCLDVDDVMCSNTLQPRHCYSAHNRALCCHSCERLRQLHAVSTDCPYGDKSAMIRKDGRTYSCEEYIAAYGTLSCSTSAQLRTECCNSCLSAARGKPVQML